MAIRHIQVCFIMLTTLCLVSGCLTECCRYSLSDCQDYRDLGHNISTVYKVVPLGMFSEIDVYCDQAEDGGGWIVIQRRIDGSVDFYQGWAHYEFGFGDIEHEYWIGLLPLWRLIVQGHYQLRINIEDWDGTTKYAHYGYFMIGKPADNYTLHVHGYSGTAGMALESKMKVKIHTGQCKRTGGCYNELVVAFFSTGGGVKGDSLSGLNGQGFSTKDWDNDGTSKHCAEIRQGGWWYGKGDYCGPSGLNGKYFTVTANTNMSGILWRTWIDDYSFRSTEMKIKRA